MSRRKRTALKPRTIVVSIVVCAAICLAGIGYLWAKTQVWALGRDIKQLELRYEELKRNTDALERVYAGMCTPARLEARIRELNLGLVPPMPQQIIRLPEPAPQPVSGLNSRMYAVATNE